MECWVIAQNVLSPLGLTTKENYTAVRRGDSGIRKVILENEQSYMASAMQHDFFQDSPHDVTNFERLLIHSVKDALASSAITPSSVRVVFILSTTKGNIDQLRRDNTKEQLLLSYSAKKVAGYFKSPNPPIVISNACISGVMALLVANRLMKSGQYDHAVVMGADVLSTFVLSGFNALNAISDVPCKPFDKHRMGISLGEAAATMIVSRDPDAGAISTIRLAGGGLSNDANHISGPSKTGEELAMAIDQAVKESTIRPDEIDFISAHGTATLYNDEMESKAFDHAGILSKPVNSLKGSFGHTLGAAGLVESAMNIEGLLQNEVLPTVGFTELGVSKEVNVSSAIRSSPLKTLLKTGSGFGGCNAAIIFQKEFQ